MTKVTNSERVDSTIADIHKTRERISDDFGGDIKAISDDARKRQEQSGRRTVSYSDSPNKTVQRDGVPSADLCRSENGATLSNSHPSTCMILTFVVSVCLCGCNDSSPQQGNTPVPTIVPRIRIATIEAGPRPSRIMGGSFRDLHDVHRLAVADVQRVCVEGTVKRGGMVMGASFISLACGKCEATLHCEGDFEKYEIPLDANVVLLGVFRNGMLGEAELLTQQQIDTALTAEKSLE